MNAKVPIMHSNPCGSGRWLITEAVKPSDGDWKLYVYCLLYEWEWSYVLLWELKQLRLPLWS